MNDKEIIKKLKSGDSSLITDTLEYIRKEGNKDILLEVVDLINRTNEDTIREKAIHIIENLKDQECAPIMIKAIENEKYKKILNVLISSCWKNGLNFSEFTFSFIEVFIRSEFLLAFEVFTVIDNFEDIESTTGNTCVLHLESSVEAITEDKKQLYFNLIDIIKNKTKNPT